MSIIAFLKNVLGKGKGGSCKHVPLTIKHLPPDHLRARCHSTPITSKKPRVYRVPDGLKTRVLELQDKSKIPGMGCRAHDALWALLEQRCPELRTGKWKLLLNGTKAYIVEVLA